MRSGTSLAMVAIALVLGFAVGAFAFSDDPVDENEAAAAVATTTPAIEPGRSVRATVPPDPAPSTSTTIPATRDGDFLATFDGGPADFYDHFDYGFSGQDPASNHNGDRLVTWQGDHDQDCGDPNTLREIDIDRDVAVEDHADGDFRDFDDMFWWCRDHLMTGIVSVGYSIGWFSPHGYFEGIQRVCWDINTTEMSTRQWTQVLFVSPEDAERHASPRGSGGFDLGYTSPTFRDQPGFPSTGILPEAGDLAGLKVEQSGYFNWFEDQDNWMSESNSSQPIVGYHDKGPRYRHCIEQIQPDTVRFTQDRPETHGGQQIVEMPGRIPQGPVRVVFQDDNYNGPKGERYTPEANTWHWDNISIETA